MSDLWATSDWHLGHKLMAQLRYPGFEAKLLDNMWGLTGDIYFLGDLQFNTKWLGAVEAMISGNKQGARWHFVRGNHDRKLTSTRILKLGFATVQDHIVVQTKFGRALLSHYPIINHDARFIGRVEALNKIYRDELCVVNIHGHTHAFSHPGPEFINACVEVNNYKAVRL